MVTRLHRARSVDTMEDLKQEERESDHEAQPRARKIFVGTD